MLNDSVIRALLPEWHEQKSQIDVVNELPLSGQFTGESFKSVPYKDPKIWHGSYIFL